MTKCSFLCQSNIISTLLRSLIYFTLIRSYFARNAFYDLDLSTQTLNPGVTGFIIRGDTLNQWFGYSISTAGDINNDGYDDIIVGTALSKNTAYVIYGGEESSLLNIELRTTTLNPLTTGFMIIGNDADDRFGKSVSTAGDINNDGYDDIIVGAPNKNSDQGAAYVIYGGAKSAMSHIDLSSITLDPLTTGFLITGNAAGDNFGWSVSSAGDINDDGYDDIIVGTFYKNAVYVIYGGEKQTMLNIALSSTTLDPTSTGFMITGNAASDSFGTSISTAGDIDNDGFDDIIVGASSKNNNQGAAYVVYGGPKSTTSHIDLSSITLDPTSTGFMITGNVGYNRLGGSVSTAGDIDNDGYDDIIVGAFGTSTAYVIYGGTKSTMINIVLSSTTLIPTSTGFIILGDAVDNGLGGSVSTAGDINNDGYDDIIIGASGKNSAQGAVYVIYGREKSTMSNIDLGLITLDPTSTGFMITGNAAGDVFGNSVHTAGDINNDGYDDIIIAAYRKDTVYVISASCSNNCNQCSSESVCTKCKNSYNLFQSKCLASCPDRTFSSIYICEDCPAHCSACTSQNSCQVCSQGYTLSNSLCVAGTSSSSQQAQETATQTISSTTKGISSIIGVGSAASPLATLVSKTVQNTRYLNLSVTSDLAEIYQTWNTELISWGVPYSFSNEDHFKTSPSLFAQYDLGSPFLVNFWPTLLNIGIGFGTFITCILLQKLFQHTKYEGWAHSLVRKLAAGCFNFGLIQAYSCLDDIFFYLVLDAKTNPFNSFFSWASMIFAVIFLALGCILVFFNFWTVKNYQSIKKQAKQDIEAFKEKNKYWELFYSDFNDNDIWSQSFFAILIIRSAMSSFIITVLYAYPVMQTSFLVILDGVIILFLYLKTPFNTLRGELAQYFYETITLLVHICSFILSLQGHFKKSSSTVQLIFSTGIIYLNTALVTGALGFMFIEIYKTISEKKRARRKQGQKEPKDNQEIQSLTQTASPLQPSGTQKGESWIVKDQNASTGNLFLLPGVHQNSSNLANSDFINLEASQILESNFNADNSRELEMYPTKRINPQRNQNTRSKMLQRKVRVLNPRQQEN